MPIYICLKFYSDMWEGKINELIKIIGLSPQSLYFKYLVCVRVALVRSDQIVHGYTYYLHNMGMVENVC